MSRRQPEHLVWPLTPQKVEALDQMLYELYKRTETAGTSGFSSPIVVPQSTMIGFAQGPAGEDGETGIGLAGATGATGAAGAAGPMGLTGDDGQDGDDAARGALNSPLRFSSMGIVIDGGGSAITTGIKGDLTVPINCTIIAVVMLADQSGSIVVDIWKDTLANYPPTVLKTITASALPTISSATNSQDTTLTGWTRSVSAGDVLRFNVNSASTITRLTLSLKVVY